MAASGPIAATLAQLTGHPHPLPQHVEDRGLTQVVIGLKNVTHGLDANISKAGSGRGSAANPSRKSSSDVGNIGKKPIHFGKDERGKALDLKRRAESEFRRLQHEFVSTASSCDTATPAADTIIVALARTLQGRPFSERPDVIDAVWAELHWDVRCAVTLLHLFTAPS